MSRKNPPVLYLRLETSLVDELRQYIPRKSGLAFPLALQRILAAGMASPYPRQLLKHGKAIPVLPRTKQVDVPVAFESVGEKQMFLLTFHNLLAQIAVSENFQRLVEASELATAIFLAYVLGKFPVQMEPRQGRRFSREELFDVILSRAEADSDEQARPAPLEAQREPSLVPTVHSKGPFRTKRDTRPHPEHPSVYELPSRWQPGTRGRPPLGSIRNPDGTWLMPKGWLEINGLWHESILCS